MRAFFRRLRICWMLCRVTGRTKVFRPSAQYQWGVCAICDVVQQHLNVTAAFAHDPDQLVHIVNSIGEWYIANTLALCHNDMGKFMRVFAMCLKAATGIDTVFSDQPTAMAKEGPRAH